ncbi:MAG TPA: hypothetical protein VKE74_11300 [Gemmataceae bacterium]|nr:hypothetical protein [Gemmataceae bacterium]
MTRVGLTLAVFLALAAWAGAQGPSPALPADVRLRMLKENRLLLNDLVHQGIALSKADNPVSRAEECEKVVRTLGAAVRRAAEAENPDRVAELGEHLDVVVRDGLVPNLDEAAGMVAPESPEAKRLKEVRERAASGLDELQSALPTTGKVGENDKVKDLRGKLGGLKERVKEK